MDMVELAVRRRVLGLVVAAGVAVVAETVGWWSSRSGGLLVVAQALHHPLLFGLSALAALTAAAVLGVRNRVVRGLVLMTAALMTLLALPFFLLGSGREVTMDKAAPHHSDRHLVVEEGAAMIDPLWWVYVDEGSGLTKRRWLVGYFNGDVADNALVEASWAGPDRIRLITGDEESRQVHVVGLTPGSGKPERTVSQG